MTTRCDNGAGRQRGSGSSAPDLVAKTQALSELSQATHAMLGAERRLRPRHKTTFNGLTILQTVTLIGLDSAGTATMGELAAFANVNPATVTGMLDELEAQGIVERERSTTDRRVTKVSLTPEGKKLAAEQRSGWEARWHRAFGDVSIRDISAAAVGIRRVTKIFEDILANEPIPEPPEAGDADLSLDHEGAHRGSGRIERG